MYSVPLINNKITCLCIMKLNGVSRAVELLVDTGAEYTVLSTSICRGFSVGAPIKRCRYKSLSGGYVYTYMYALHDFSIGRCIIGSCNINICCDDNFTQSVLGMDLLSRLDFSFNSNKQIMSFCNTSAPRRSNDRVPSNDMRYVTEDILSFLDKRDKLDYVMSCLPEAGDIPFSQLRDLVIGLVSSH